MKTYKHKTLWYEAYLQENKTYYILRLKHNIPIELIEGSLDWILQPEKDWIDEVLEDYWKCQKDDLWVDKVIYIREIIEKHMPKITEELDIRWIIDSILYQADVDYISDFGKDEMVVVLKEKWLYKE